MSMGHGCGDKTRAKKAGDPAPAHVDLDRWIADSLPVGAAAAERLMSLPRDDAAVLSAQWIGRRIG